MKKVIVFAVIAALVGCADSRTFRRSDGTEFTAKPYGWMDKENRIDGVEYDVCAGNIVWSIVLGETVIAPVLITGLALWEPVSFVEPNK